MIFVKQIDPQVLRFFMLSVHYRHPINFSARISGECRKQAWNVFVRLCKFKHRLDATADLGDHAIFGS